MREVAYERFKAQLFKRNLVPGQFVSQGELCALLDVPLGPTREALKRLEAESLVRLIPQRGIQIADIGVTLIHEAFEFRDDPRARGGAPLRRHRRRRHARSSSSATTARGARADSMAAGDDRSRGCSTRALQVDWGMHNLIIESVGNHIMMTAHQQNFDKIKMIRLHGRSPRYLPLAMEEHLAVIEAMKRRDPEPRRRRSSSICRPPNGARSGFDDA